ncbi:hypothetical protein [Nitratifractor sp.]|uniref:hypothetical protein n=1 Tax=Nitratifractor sp. TaxID=2268144 RepID=UPI0025DA61FD|nr:hypothetical protein [Nitratifractor sp.]
MRRSRAAFFIALSIATAVSTSQAASEKPFHPGVMLGDMMPAKMREQNRDIVRKAAASLSKELPKKVDAYTTLESVRAEDTTLLYTFSLTVGPKSDEAIRKEGEARMRRNVTRGVCRGSRRFLDAGITVAYRYLNAATGKELFRFDIDKKACEKAGLLP